VNGLKVGLMLSSVLMLLCWCSGGGGASLTSLPGVVQPTIVASASPTSGFPDSTGNPSGSPAEESGGSGGTPPLPGSAPSEEEEPNFDPTTGFVPSSPGSGPTALLPEDELDRLFPNLPPDPGEAGKQTLEGMDADGDGVRDDVQRWIYRRYSNEELKRKAMLQYAKALQASIVNVNRDRPEQVRQRAIETLRANDCAYGIFGGIDQTSEERRIVDLQILNTQERVIASLTVDAKLSGQLFNLAETICIQPIQ
jgi:hypothetical protein